MHRVPCALLLMSLTSLTMALPELKGNPQELQQYLLTGNKTVTLTGQGEEKVEADNGLVALLVKTKDSKLSVALQKNRSVRAELKKKLEAAGIAASQIHTAKYSSTPGYSWFSDKPSSYEIANEVKITINKEEELGAIAELVDSNAEIFFGAITTKYSKTKEAKAKALEKSLADVLEKKAVYEKQFGIKLTVISIQDTSTEINSMQNDLRTRQSYNDAKGKLYSNLSRNDASVPAAAVGLEDRGNDGFGEVMYRAQTTVIYAIK